MQVIRREIVSEDEIESIAMLNEVLSKWEEEIRRGDSVRFINKKTVQFIGGDTEAKELIFLKKFFSQTNKSQITLILRY